MEAQRCTSALQTQLSSGVSSHTRGAGLEQGDTGLCKTVASPRSPSVLESEHRAATSVWDAAGHAAGYQNIKLQRVEVRKLPLRSKNRTEVHTEVRQKEWLQVG